MKSKTLACAAGACLAASSHVSAAPAERQGAQVLQEYADCVVATDYIAATTFLRTFPYSDRERRAANAIVLRKKSCADRTSIRFAPLYLRGAISEALYRKRFPSPPAPGVVPAVDVAEPNWPSQKELGSLHKLAACVVSYDATSTHSMIAARRGSQTEQAALVALQPTLNECGKQIGKMTIVVDILRAGLAESLYRLASLQRGEEPFTQEAVLADCVIKKDGGLAKAIKMPLESDAEAADAFNRAVTMCSVPQDGFDRGLFSSMLEQRLQARLPSQ